MEKLLTFCNSPFLFRERGLIIPTLLSSMRTGLCTVDHPEQCLARKDNYLIKEKGKKKQEGEGETEESMIIISVK